MSDEELMAKIAESVKLAPEGRHSYFQLKHFVLGKEPTVQSQMWQALRELYSRKETIEALTAEIEEAKDLFDLAGIDAESLAREVINDQMPNHDLLTRRRSIKLRQIGRKQEKLRRSVEQLNKRIEFAKQEAKYFLIAFEKLNKIEDLKNYDDEGAQKEYWNEKISEQIYLKTLLKQPLDTDAIQTALALHEDAPIKRQVIQLLDRIKLEAKRSNAEQITKKADERE